MLTTTLANIVPLTWMSSICLQQHLPTSILDVIYMLTECQQHHLYAYNNVSQHRTINLNVILLNAIYMLTHNVSQHRTINLNVIYMLTTTFAKHRTINLNVIYMLTTTLANIVPLTWMSSICLQQHLPTSYHQLECHLYAYNNICQHRTINLNVIYMLTTTLANIVPSTWMSSICLQQHLPTSYHQLECHLYAYNNVCQHRTINLNVIYMLTTTLANIVPLTWMSSICLQQR